MQKPPMGYSIALIAVALTAGIKLLLDWLVSDTGTTAPFLLFYIPVFVSAWYGGAGAGMVAVALSTIVINYLFLPPAVEFKFNIQAVALLSLFILISTILVLLVRGLKHARRQASEQLQRFAASEQQYRDLTRQVQSYAIFGTDANGIITSWNEGVERVLGYAEQEFVGREASLVFTPEDIAADIPATEMQQAALKGQANDERWHMRKNGDRFWVTGILTALYDKQGNVRGFTKVMRDITDRKHLADALAASEARLRSVFNSSIIGIAFTHGDTIVEANDTYLRMLEFTHDDLRTGAIKGSKIIAPESRKIREEGRETLRRTGAVTPFEADLIGKNGRRVPVIVGGAEIERGGEVVWFALDNTQRKSVELNLRLLFNTSAVLGSSLEYQNTLTSVAQLAVQSLADLCMADIVDADGKVQHLAVEHRNSKERAKARKLLEQFPLDPVSDSGVAEAIRTGKPILVPEMPADAALDAANNTAQLCARLGLHSYMILPLIARGRTLGALTFAANSYRQYTQDDLAVAEDLARHAALAIDNARLYADVREANRLRDEFLATVSHELRTPLTSMVGWIALMRSGKLDEVTFSRALDTLDRNVKAQRQLIEDLLDVSRIISGKFPLRTGPVQMANVLDDAIEACRPAAEAKNLQIKSEYDYSASAISGDADRLQQVVWNVLTNAIKFTPHGGRIVVKLEHSGGNIRVVVSDSGKGIRPEFLPFVFERFRQADATSTRRFSGLGIGLAIVRHIVELHGGHVEATSEGEGKGATFTITLPIAAETSAEVDTPFPLASLPGENQALLNEDISLSGINVLIVDDDDDTREFLRRLLEQHEATVVCAASVEAAMQTLGTFQPDVIVSDIAMPGEDGRSLIRRVRGGNDATRGVPAVALTAYVRELDRGQLEAEGFNRCIAKPVMPTDLVKAVAELTGRVSNAAGE